MFFLSSLNILIYCLVPALLFLCMEAGAINKQDLSVFSTGRETVAHAEIRSLEYIDGRITIPVEELPAAGGHIRPEKSQPPFRYQIRSGGRKPGAIGLRAPPF